MDVTDKIANAIEVAKNLADWEPFTPRCADNRVTAQFDLLNKWVVRNIRHSQGELTRQTLVNDKLENLCTLPKLVGLNRAESILAKSESIQ